MMFEHVAVTTFSPEGYDAYGKRMLESFLEHWQIPIVVVHEGEQPALSDSRLIYLDICRDGQRNQWIAQHSRPPFLGDPRNPNMQAIRFSHKIWAVTGWRPSTDWWIWMDADIEWRKKVDPSVLMPQGKLLSFLGRQKCRFPRYRYTEAGFIAYKVKDIRVSSMLDDMRHVYTSGELFHLGLNCWHDSYVFDHCRRRSGVAEAEQFDMTGHLKGGLDVWERSPLAEFGVHNKGPQRKMSSYGKVVP